MDDIELNNLDKPEEEPEEQEEQETDFIEDDKGDQSLVIIGGFNPEILNPSEDVADVERSYTQDKEDFLREKIGVIISKDDGSASEELFKKLRLTVDKRSANYDRLVINGGEYDGTKVIVKKNNRFVYTEYKSKRLKVNEFKRLVERVEREHGETGVAVVEEAVPDITVNKNLANSVLRNSIERLESEIDERFVDIEVRSVETSVTLDKEKIREFKCITKTADHNLDNGGLKVQEEYFRNLARDGPKELRSVRGCTRLYEEMADVCVLKADEIRLRRNQRPESELARSIVEEEAQNNDLTRFERFKRWTKKNLGGISVVAVSVAAIITTIVMGARNVKSKKYARLEILTVHPYTHKVVVP